MLIPFIISTPTFYFLDTPNILSQRFCTWDLVLTIVLFSFFFKSILVSISLRTTIFFQFNYFLFIFGLEVTPNSTQGLLLVLFSGIAPGGFRGHIGCWRSKLDLSYARQGLCKQDNDSGIYLSNVKPPFILPLLK